MLCEQVVLPVIPVEVLSYLGIIGSAAKRRAIHEVKWEISAKYRRKSNEEKGFIILNLFGFINHDWMWRKTGKTNTSKHWHNTRLNRCRFSQNVPKTGTTKSRPGPYGFW